MATKPIDGEYVKQVFHLVKTYPAQSNISELLTAHARIGYLCAVAEGNVDDLEMRRKYAEADAMLQKRNEDPKCSVVLLEAHATVVAQPLRAEEGEARLQHRKLANLLESISQVISVRQGTMYDRHH
jgi:hypothetical protein